MHIRGNGDAKVSERDVIRGQIRWRARTGAQKRKRLSILQQIPQTGLAAQGRDDNLQKRHNRYIMLLYNVSFLKSIVSL